MKRTMLSVAATACMLSATAQRLLVVNDTLAIDVSDIDHISYTKDPNTSNLLLPEQLAADPKTTIFSQALQLTGLADSLLYYDDPTYPAELAGQTVTIRVTSGGSNFQRAQYLGSRLRRFTAFVETDSVFRAAGIYSLDDLVAWAKKTYDGVYGPDAYITDPTDRRNSLNRFVAYHLLPFATGYSRLTAVNDQNVYLERNMPGTTRDVSAFYQTLMPAASLKCSFQRSAADAGIYLNRKGLQDNYTIRGAHILKDASTRQYDHWTDNGTYYYIDQLLAYDNTTQYDALIDTWRIDFKALSPDLLNISTYHGSETYWALPSRFVSNYSTDGEIVALSSPSEWWRSYEGDAVICSRMRNLTVKLPGLPMCRWQVRLGYNCGADRPVINTYIDGVPQFENVDLREYKMPEDIEADANLFAGPDDYYCGEEPMSAFSNSLRRVVGQFLSDGERNNYLRIEIVSDDPDSYLPLDYLELVPVFSE